MAKVTLKSYIKSIHGRTGNVIYYNVKGHQYARAFSIPRNPRTVAQQRNRATFAEAVKLWQGLSPEEKSYYNLMAEGKPASGYNIFISMQMKGVTLKIIKQAPGVQIKVSLIPGSHLIRTTSVSPSPVLATGRIYIYPGTGGCNPLFKKPPGIRISAAERRRTAA